MAVFLRPLSKKIHYGNYLLHRLHCLFLHPPGHRCAEVGLAHLCRQRLVLVCGLGVERWWSEPKNHQRTRKRNTMKKLVNLFKKHKEKEQQEDTAIFHCSDCGNDFEDQRNIADYDLNTDNLTLITKYSYRKCPKCGNWSSTQNTIEQL